jgi:hypothetical protein
VGIAAKHRGIASARSVIVPIPLDEPAPAGSREAARARLGLHPSDVLILTIASEYKFGDADGGHYLDAVLPAVEANPRIVVRAVGPRPIGPWAAAEKASGGRIVALGEQSEVADYYAAADVYLDSFPVSSFTSMLEAGLAGVPVITRVDSRSRDGFFEFEELDGNAGVIRAVGASEAASALSRWVADTGGRVRAGAELRQMLRATHTGPGWLHSIELAYERATAPLGDDLASADPLAQRLVADLADAHRRGGVDAAYLSAVWKETPGRWAARLTELACSAWAIRREPDLLSAWAARYGERARDRLRSSRRAD